MENVSIQGLGDLKVVTELFSQVGCTEDDNCILVVTNRDFIPDGTAEKIMKGNATIVGAKTGGAVGGLVGGAVAGSFASSVQESADKFLNSLDHKQQIVFDTGRYAGFLLNVISTGIGVIPCYNGGQILANVKDLTTDIDNFVFFSNDEIESKELKKLPLNFSSMMFSVLFKSDSELKVKTPWQMPKKHKLIPYQEENFKKLASRL